MADVTFPIKHDLKGRRGDTKEWSFYVEDNTGTEEVPVWTPRVWDDYEFVSQIRTGLDRETDVVCDFAVDATEPGWVKGFLTIIESEKLPGQTDVNSKPVLYWDVQYTWTEDGKEKRRTHYAGKFTVTGDVSHA